jgi:hypothetical protein
MNVTEYTYLINKPDIHEKKQTELWKSTRWVSLFSKCQSHQLGLYNQTVLNIIYIKITTAYSTDRSVLFEFITLIRLLLFKGLYDKKALRILDIQVVDRRLSQLK